MRATRRSREIFEKSTLEYFPLGVLHHEPDRLLLDETSDLARTASVLNVVARGAHRVSAIGARLTLPATTLSRPLGRLVELGLLAREVPFGADARDTKRSRYLVADPFLSFWFRFVDPNRSRLASGQIDEVAADLEKEWPQFLGGSWERLVRDSVARGTIGKTRWHPASRWWGPDVNRRPLEIDVIARSSESAKRVLVGEVKLTLSAREVERELESLRDKAARCPVTRGKDVTLSLWVLHFRGARRDRAHVLGPDDVVNVLK